VRAQGWPGLEIVVVDNGSTDDTERVLCELEGGDLRCLSQPKAGAAAARNLGIRESGGDLVAFLDADDRWLPGKLDAQTRALACGDYAFAYCGSLLVDEGGETRGLRLAAPGGSRLEELVWGNPIATPSVVVSRAALYEVGLFDESLNTLGEDWDLWLRLAAAGFRGACVAEPLVAIRLGDFHGKYRVRDFERATLRIVSRLFDTAAARPDLAHVSRLKSRVVSWHQSVLAKNYLEVGGLSDFLRCAARCVAAHPLLGWYYLAPGRLFGARFKGTPRFDGR
jgi:glycosyltransferase involved in cell wall biosynthesis